METSTELHGGPKFLQIVDEVGSDCCQPAAIFFPSSYIPSSCINININSTYETVKFENKSVQEGDDTYFTGLLRQKKMSLLPRVS